jgi:hypothetical protein
MTQPSNPIPQPTPVRRERVNDAPRTPNPTKPSVPLPVTIPRR